MDSWQDTRGRACYRIKGPLAKDWYVNQFLYIPDDDGDQGLELVVSKVEDSMAELRVVRDYRAAKTSVWGIHAKNREQNFALNLLLDPDRSEEHTSELQSLMRISYAVFCLKKKNTTIR